MSCSLRLGLRICLLAALAAPLATTAVARQGTPPPSSVLPVPPAEDTMLHELAPIAPERLLAEDAARATQRPGPQRFALPADVTITPATYGTWEILPDGGRLWRLRVSSPNATDLNFGFSRYRLPAGATLHLVSLDRDYFQGPFTADDNRPHGELWTPVIPGQRAVIELYVPPEPDFEPELVLGRIGRGYRDLFRKTGDVAKQGSCNIDVVCGADDGLDWVDDWRAEIQSVAMYSIEGFTACSGTMVADQPATNRPYFLTANHCEVTEGNAHTVVTYWNYQSPECGLLRGGTLDQSISGATLRASRAGADFALLELDETPPEGFNVFWSGWDRRESQIPQGSVTIHHPSTDEKAISLNDDPLTILSACDIYDGLTGQLIDRVVTPWQVDNWEQGTTEYGSSGAGMWDTTTRLLVGTLSGGNASCSNPAGTDCYARFAVGWDGDAPDERLRDWLDPDGTDATTVVGRFADGSSGTGKQFSCGNAGYDSDTSEGIAFFGGGHAGDPNFMFAVRFSLADFGFAPRQVEITGFCAANQLAFEGGPWPNEVFVYPDVAGAPDGSQILGQGTIITGDGSGDSIVMLDQPVPLNGDFWLINRGDPKHAGEDFNMEFDAGPNDGTSFQSSAGVANLISDTDPGDFPAGVNYLLRAYLQPAGSGPTYGYLVAGVARVRGREGTNFRSKLALINRSDVAADVSVSFIRESSTVTEQLVIADGEQRTWDNVVEDLFGITDNTSGAVKVESNRPLVVTARTYNLTENGTFGQFLPGVVSSETLSDDDIGIISQLVNNASFRSNVGFLNLSAMECQVRVQLYDSGGTTIGSPVSVSIGPMSWKQVNDIFAAAGAGSRDNAYARVEILTPNCSIWGYGSLADNLTGDPTTIPMEAE